MNKISIGLLSAQAMLEYAIKSGYADLDHLAEETIWAECCVCHKWGQDGDSVGAGPDGDDYYCDEHHPERKARKWNAEYPGGLSIEHTYDEPTAIDVVRADQALWHEVYLQKTGPVPEGMKYVPLDWGGSRRYSLRISVVEVDDEGEEIEDGELDAAGPLLATTDAVALQHIMLHLDAIAKVEMGMLPAETLSSIE
jgi:hypothetical protein